MINDQVRWIFALCFLVVACSADNLQSTASPANSEGEEITVTSSDDVMVYGSVYFGDLDNSAPIIHLFHQGGSNGRAEYAPLIDWINENGFRAIAWDQRVGGELYGQENRTANAWGGDEDGYCHAYPDIKAAIVQGKEYAGDAAVVIWGSSYSGSLIFRAASELPDHVDAVIAFSPASGAPMMNCSASNFADGLQDPAFALSPMTEIERESVMAQRAVLEQVGVRYDVVENGIHGSSMLVDERTENDMSATRAEVMGWLKEQTQRN